MTTPSPATHDAERALPPVPRIEPDDAKHLRTTLAGCGFTERELPRLYGLDTMADMRRLSPATRHHAEANAPDNNSIGHALVTLFLHGKHVDAGSLADLGGLDPWERAGLIEHTTSGVLATVNLVPFRGAYIASDRPRTPDGVRRVHADHVMGVGGSSLTLASLTIRRPVERALDLGCGCGVHALLAARHAQHVLATDLSERAVEFTRCNAVLNGHDNIEAVAGDLYDPAGERRFGLVVSNPPFVISPETSFVYRDSPLPGDELVERVVRGAAERLEPGGYAAILANWIHPAGSSWQNRLRSWIEPAGCDGLVMQSMASSGVEYAEKWIEHTGSNTSADDALDRWLSYFDEQRIEAVGSGLIVAHRPIEQRENVFVPAHAPDDWTADERAGEHLAGLIDAAVWLEATDDAQLLATPLAVSSDARITHELAPHAEQTGWQVESATLRLDTGLAGRARLDGFTSQLMMGLDGSTPAGAVIDAVAASLGVTPEDARSAAPRVLRNMVGAGYLTQSS